MEDTGRIRRALHPRARRIVFGDDADRAIDRELGHYVEIDRAHLVMLVERGLLPAEAGRDLLEEMEALRASGFAPLRGRQAPRGLYLLYESHLVERLGERVGGAVHLGRSRNDINATVLRLRLREHHHRLARELLRLIAVLARRAARYAEVTMPVYTHYQPALPVTYGHYLAGVGLALERDLRGWMDAAAELGRSPLGAGAAGGTTVPIDAERTAALLGFDAGVLHSLDAVASRDLVLRLLSAAAVLGVTLSRLATDLQLWSSAELGLVAFPDTLVGSSSMMPQKRNAFLLEHVQGRAGAALGAFTAAATAMHATPFTNSVAVGTEGTRGLWGTLDDVHEAVVLSRLVAAGAEPCPERMLRRAEEGYTAATELANRLVLATGTSFRKAHHRVGSLVAEALERGEPLASAAGSLLREEGVRAEAGWLDPAAVAAAAGYGGGPGRPALDRALDALLGRAREHASALRARAARWAAGTGALDAAAAALRAGGAAPAAEGAETAVSTAEEASV